jgi:hypothetical protein
MMNRVIRKQLQAINTHLMKLNTRKQVSENSNNASTSADCSKLPSKPEINPRREAKAITSRDEVDGSKFSNIQKVKETLRSGTSYQGPTMLTDSEEENTRRAPDENLVNLEEPVVKEVPFEKEPKRTEPTSCISPAPKSEPARTSKIIEESNPNTTRIQIMQSICTDFNSSKKKEGTKT